MSTPPPPLTGPQLVAFGTVAALILAASSAALWGTSEQSERGFRLLNWLHKHSESELNPSEADL